MQSHPVDDAQIRIGMLFDNFFVHSSVMMRKEALVEVGGYSEDVTRQPPEDYELWSRVMRHGQLANLAEPLLAYREVANSMSRSGKSPFSQKLALISAENLARAADLSGDKPSVLNLAHLMAGNYENLSAMHLMDSLEVLNLAITGLGEKTQMPIEVLEQAKTKWRQRCLVRYFDYRTGGFFSTHFQGRLRRWSKKLLFARSKA